MKMNFKLRRLRALLFCIASGSLPLLAHASTVGQRNIGFGKPSVSLMPEGCGNPYQDMAALVAFYDLTIETIAAHQGPKAKGVAELFAVSEMKKETDAMLINPQEESAVDRLIASQLCQFQKIQTANRMQGKSTDDPTKISSENTQLHEHLLMISSKLYRDTRKLAVEILAARAKALQKKSILEQKWLEVRRARQEGRAKIRDLFE